MRVDADDFARPCSCGREHQIAVKEILIEAGAVEKLEEEMSEGMLREYISPLVICDTNTYAATEELIEFNPADNLGQRFSKPKKQNMPALPPSELPRFLVALNNASIRLETRLPHSTLLSKQKTIYQLLQSIELSMPSW